MDRYSRFEVSLMRTLLETETITFSDAIYIYLIKQRLNTQTMRLPT